MSSKFDSDITIVGGGLNGLTQALTLASADFSVTLVDALAPETALGAAFDGRVFAIAFAPAGCLRLWGSGTHWKKTPSPSTTLW